MSGESIFVTMPLPRRRGASRFLLEFIYLQLPGLIEEPWANGSFLPAQLFIDEDIYKQARNTPNGSNNP